MEQWIGDRLAVKQHGCRQEWLERQELTLVRYGSWCRWLSIYLEFLWVLYTMDANHAHGVHMSCAHVMRVQDMCKIGKSVISKTYRPPQQQISNAVRCVTSWIHTLPPSKNRFLNPNRSIATYNIIQSY